MIIEFNITKFIIIEFYNQLYMGFPLFKSLKGFYTHIPLSLQKFIGYSVRNVPLSLRKGRVFRKYCHFLEESQWWTSAELEAYQLSQLSHLLQHAYDNVPYYQELFNSQNLRPRDIDDFSELEQIPVLTKTLIQQNYRKLRAQNYPPSSFQPVATGGSTGQPLSFFYQKKYTDPFESAFIWRYYHIIGIRPTDERVELGGRLFDARFSSHRLYHYHIPDRCLYLSSYHLTPSYLHKYYNLISQKSTVVLSGYPSSLYFLAQYMVNHELDFANIKLVHTHSENLYSHMIATMEQAFQAPVFDHYGNSERCAYMHQCEQHGLYHIPPEYGILELRDPHGNFIHRNGENGEIIATGFSNFVFPFIRYQTEDIAQYSGKKCECDRNFDTISSIQGRSHEFIVCKDNRLISLTALNMHSAEFRHVRDMQFVQHCKGELLVRIIPDSLFSPTDEQAIHNYLLKKCHNSIAIEFSYPSTLSKSPSGKSIWLIQKIKIEY